MAAKTLLALACLFSTSWGFSLPKIFKDGMVLQSDAWQIWGFMGDSDKTIRVNFDCSGGLTMDAIANQDGNKWYLLGDPIDAGTTCVLKFTQDENNEVIVLGDVIFGDVWVCSGQSNMEWSLSNTFNGTDEITRMAEYPNIRLYRLNHMTSDMPQDEIMNENLGGWGKTDDATFVGGFSAVCLLTASYMADALGKDTAFGLIETNWGGTRIEPWSTPEGLAECEIDDFVNEDQPQQSNSYLYNAMIHPLIRLGIKGALWYQGESNGGWNRDKYQCTFPAMINEWRRIWSQTSPTSPNFPFGFMQLGTIQPSNNDNPAFPVIRWHQTADVGVVPNDIMNNNEFMAVVLDTYDKDSGIHPRNKQLVSQRLAWAGLATAYQFDGIPLNGPFPVYWDFIDTADGFQVEILYDSPFDWNPTESEGFYYCCEEDFDQCDQKNGAWQKLPEGSVAFDGDLALALNLNACATGLAYLWANTPVLGTEALPIYGKDSFRLPAAPWKRQVAV